MKSPSNKCKHSFPSIPTGFRIKPNCYRAAPASHLHLSLVLTFNNYTSHNKAHSTASSGLKHSPLLRMSSHFWFTRITPQSIQRLSCLFINLPPNAPDVFSSSMLLQHPLHTSTTVPKLSFMYLSLHVTMSFLKAGTVSHLCISRPFYRESTCNCC